MVHKHHATKSHFLSIIFGDITKTPIQSHFLLIVCSYEIYVGSYDINLFTVLYQVGDSIFNIYI